MRGPGGTIAVKGHYAGAAREEAAELWSCDAEEIEVTGEEEYNGVGWSTDSSRCSE